MPPSEPVYATEEPRCQDGRVGLSEHRRTTSTSTLTHSSSRSGSRVTDAQPRVIPFLFIALLLEEVIPLIAIYAPFMLPSTCILPSQRARIEEKKTEKAVAYASHYRHLFAQLEQSQNPTGHLLLRALNGGDGPLAVCGYGLLFSPLMILLMSL